MAAKPTLDEAGILAFLTTLFAEHLHAKRVLSLSLCTLGVIHAASLAIHAIGIGMAEARGVASKHAIKQVDRMLSNSGIDVGLSFGCGCLSSWETGERSSLRWTGPNTTTTTRRQSR